MPDPKPKRPAPFCIRLSEGERARLERDAAGVPLGSYIKAKALSRSTGRAADRHVEKQALRRLAGAIGTAQFVSDLRQLAAAGRSGLLALTPETDQQLRLTLKAAEDMVRAIMAALGSRNSHDH